MEKQIEKFRQRLIADGNAPEKVPRYSSDADGQLSIDLWAELKVSDISELRGVAVTKFKTFSSSLRDLSPLAGAPLRELTLYPQCGVSDISPLRDAPLETLYLDVVPVRDISIVRKMPLKNGLSQRLSHHGRLAAGGRSNARNRAAAGGGQKRRDTPQSSEDRDDLLWVGWDPQTPETNRRGVLEGIRREESWWPKMNSPLRKVAVAGPALFWPAACHPFHSLSLLARGHGRTPLLPR